MEERNLHFDYLPSASWVLTIMSRLQQSSSLTLRQRAERWGGSPLRELGMAIATKVEILAQSLKRFRIQSQRLTAEMESNVPQLEDCLANGYAFQLKNKLLGFELLLDVDSFVFETRSLYEIVGKFLRNLFSILFDRDIDEKDLSRILSDKGIDTRWIDELRENRKLFFHETAPWIGAQVSQVEPLKYQLLVLKRHTSDFSNRDSYISFEELRGIHDGFVSAMNALHNAVMEEIVQFEAQDSGSPSSRDPVRGQEG